MMKEYKKIEKQLREAAFAAALSNNGRQSDLLLSSAGAIKELVEKCEDMEAALDTEIEYGNELKRKINSLTHNCYYTGTYIKSLMEVENE